MDFCHLPPSILTQSPPEKSHPFRPGYHHSLDLQTSHMTPLGLSIKSGLLPIFHGPWLRAGLRGGQGTGERKEGLTEDRLRPRGRGKTVKGGVKLGCQARPGEAAGCAGPQNLHHADPGHIPRFPATAIDPALALCGASVKRAWDPTH